MFLWFVGGSIVLVLLVFQSPAIDYRMVALGSVLPVGELVFGGPRLLHTLLGAVLVLVAVMALTGRRRVLRRRLLGIPIGLFLHLVLDGVWTRSSLFWWPFKGVHFEGELPEVSRGLWSVALELAGAVMLVFLWRACGLDDAERRNRFRRTGQLSLVRRA